MSQNKKEVHFSSPSNISHIEYKMKRPASAVRLELCDCLPLSEARQEGDRLLREELPDGEQSVLISPLLKEKMHLLLQELFPRVEPLSILMLHLSQRESMPLAPHSSILYKRRRYHAPPGLLEQVLANVRRVIRIEDEMLIHENTGVVILLPDVDQQGVRLILERVYSSICLLQSETLIPPLTRETTITLGIGSYPEPAPTVDMLYEQAGRVAQSLILRPVITTQLRGVKPIPSRDGVVQPLPMNKEVRHADVDLTGIPFMELPRALPVRLTQLIPFSIAAELRCVPVGRDQHCLTVAMSNPADSIALHRLQRLTGMAIFPVACDGSALDALLSQAW